MARHWLWVCLPFSVVLFSLRQFYLNGLTLIYDGRYYFTYINYYLNHIMRGVYPMWNPFDVWGRPNLFSRFIGEFNPFYYIAVIPNYLGLSVHASYAILILFYYFLGALGVYGIIWRLLKDVRSAFLGVTLFLFSSIGHELFSDYIVVFMLVPSIWFFFFLIRFTQLMKVRDLIGITFTSMLIAITYIPFYFFTLFMTMVLGYLCLFPIDFKNHLIKYFRFIKGHKIVSCLCILSVLIAVLPGVLWVVDGKSGEK